MKLKSKVYRLASKDLENAMRKNMQLGCCWHMARASNDTTGQYNNNAYIKKFEDYFKPNSDDDYYFGGVSDEKSCLARMLALDLMAEIIKKGDA